ncbi:MAG: DUF1566 domain-containing protein [Bacteroidales bacterium]|nr:DUF1566 domain-containing protein [Bacteroidales bacterium]
MRKYILLIALLSINAMSLFAQSPKMFKYQAVLRDATGEIIALTPKAINVIILQGSPAGTSVFSETHNITTTAQGLITINVGSIDTTAFAAINWENGPFFIKIKVDTATMGTSQLLSVPYALQSKTVENETDPVFNAHVAHSINSIDTNKWNTAYEWGNHDTAGYLKSYTETDPIFNAHIAHSINSTDTNKWNTTYKWGNHDTAGYLKSFTESDPLFDSTFNIINPVKNQILKYDSASGKWINVTSGTANISIPGQTAGDMMYYDGANWVRIPKGTEGQVLIMQSNVPTWKTRHYIGESYGGGTIFYVDATGQHGLIAAPNDQSSGIAWSNITNVAIGASASSHIDGLTNTNAIVAQPGHTSSAALTCKNYSGGGYNDWYLPATTELTMMYTHWYVINYFTKTAFYWTSTEYDFSTSWYHYFFTGAESYSAKTNSYRVRAIRRF